MITDSLHTELESTILSFPQHLLLELLQWTLVLLAQLALFWNYHCDSSRVKHHFSFNVDGTVVKHLFPLPGTSMGHKFSLSASTCWEGELKGMLFQTTWFVYSFCNVCRVFPWENRGKPMELWKHRRELKKCSSSSTWLDPRDRQQKGKESWRTAWAHALPQESTVWL